eukprot:g8487.t1
MANNQGGDFVMEDLSSGSRTFKGTELNAQQNDEFQKLSVRPPNVNGLGSSSAMYSENPPYSDLEEFGINEPLQFSEKPLNSSLTKMSLERSAEAVQMFQLIQRYMGLTEESLDPPKLIETAVQLMDISIKCPELRTELYIQLIKQSNSAPNLEYKQRVWELWLIAAATFDPSKEYITPVSEYIHGVMHDASQPEWLREMISRVWKTVKATTKSGSRRQALSADEIEALLSNRKLKTTVMFLDGGEHSLQYHITSTVEEAIQTLAESIHLVNYQTFALYEIRKIENIESGVLTDEYKYLEDNRYITDVLSQSDTMETRGPRFLFKKRMFRDQDEHIVEPMFLSLSYIQAQHDYLEGNYPVAREDAAQMCALQIIVAQGINLKRTDDEFKEAAERFTTQQILMSHKRNEWYQDVYRRYSAFSQMSKESGKMQFLRILRSLPYGNSVFFPVKRIDDPIGLLPSKVILGINKRGVHFFRPVPKEYLHSAELRDIMQFGSSNNAIFIKMKVAGVLHVFQFQTLQGDEICMCLQTHIGDIMMKRYAKARQMTESQRRSNHGLATANFGQKYEQHMRRMEQKLKEEQHHIEELDKKQKAIEYELENSFKELNTARENLRNVECEKSNIQIDLIGTRRQITALNRELCDLNAARAAAEKSKLSAINEVQESIDVTKARELEVEVKSKEAEITVAKEKCNSKETELAKLQESQSQIVDRLSELDELSKTEVQSLKTQISSFKTSSKDQARAKDVEINELMEKLADMTAMYNEILTDIEQVREEKTEVKELLDLKADIERREQSHALVIEGQSKRIEFLDKQYKEEQIMRKRYFNQIEDLKGKIRVYCRVRPMLQFEKNKGQGVGVSVPDELTITHQWKQEKKDREYVFDQVFTPEIKQEEVFESTKHLVQSAVDGYNVCIFAYGQTGSGKTFTIYGSDSLPGLTPRGVHELFRILERDSVKFTSSVKAYMLELYQDTIVDLLSPPKKKPVKLDIKTDAGGMVVVHGATMKDVISAQQLMDVINSGQKRRHVSATNMNRESSRSHLIMSFIIETTNLQTQAVSRGKLSFVDLAGSERVKKSGASGEQMKEAQAINKSLSALGDVISSLATGTGHVPYRNHKLTMLMSDSLGGNAKTLMFVNVSPTDANLDETQNSLLYATRVKAIKNDASKILMAKEQAKLKKQINHWRNRTDAMELIEEF